MIECIRKYVNLLCFIFLFDYIISNMPRKPAVPHDQIFQIVKQFDVFDFAKGTIKNSVNPVWIEICKKLENRVSPVSLYLYILQNRHNILDKLKKFLGLHDNVQRHAYIDFKQYDQKSSIDESYTTVESSTTDSEDEIFKKCLQKNLNKINFNISFSKEEWLKIKPQEKMRKDGLLNFYL